MTEDECLYVAMFRGINVGGNNLLPMTELVSVLNSLGLSDIKTYIQSGNAMFRSAENNRALLADNIGEALQTSHGFRPALMLLNQSEFLTAATANPFPQAADNPKTLHLYFMAEPPANPEIDKLDDLRQNGEQFELINQVFYLLAPGGIGRSKLAVNAENLLGTPATARNWRTVSRLLTMIETYN